MLYIIGLGLGEKDLSINSQECLKRAELILYEEYTASISNKYITEIARIAGRQPRKVKRSDLEDHAGHTIEEAKDKDIAILFPGDPLIATTHHILLEEAAAQGIKAKVIHAPSIFTAAIGESGLDIYKFGPTATIPRFSEKYRPESFAEVIKKNLKNKQHTLVLLDVAQDNGQSIPAEEAISNLTSAGSGSISIQTKVLFMADMGREEQWTIYASLAEIVAIARKRKPASACLIIPAEMSFAEERAVSMHLLPVLEGKDQAAESE